MAVGAGALFSVAVHSYRLRRVDTDWRRRRDEVLLSPEEAAGVLEQAIAEHEGDRHLQQVLRAASVRLAGVHPQGMFVLLRIEPEVERVQLPVAPAPPAATPSALRPSLPVEVSSRSDEPILGDDQAAVLRQAAVLGVPFCEECARIAAERRAAMQ